MCMVAYLASVVNPAVAAAAAQAAMQSLLGGDKASASDTIKKEADHGTMELEVNNSNNNNDLSQPFNADLQAAAAAALGAASVKAKLLAQKEEQEIQRLVSQVIDLQVRKLELKLSMFEKLEQDMEAELRSVRGARIIRSRNAVFLREIHSCHKCDMVGEFAHDSLRRPECNMSWRARS